MGQSVQSAFIKYVNQNPEAGEWVLNLMLNIEEFSKDPVNHAKVKSIGEAGLVGAMAMIGYVWFRNKETFSTEDEQALMQTMTYLSICNKTSILKEYP